MTAPQSSAPVPGPADVAGERQRLASLHELDILDTLPERDYDDLVQLASAVCGTPVGLVSLVDRDRQWFKAKVGVDVDQTPLEVSFCKHAIADPDRSVPFEVPDATADPRFADNPLVTGDLHLRFYAGVPLVMDDGHAMGALCVVDRQPRRLTPEQSKALQTIARGVVARLELHRQNRRLRRENASLAQGHLRLLLESTGEGILGVDRDGRCTFANRAAADLLGYGRDELLGRDVHDLSHPHHGDGRPAGASPLVQARFAGQPFRLAAERLFRRDGTSFWADLAGFPVRDGPAGNPSVEPSGEPSGEPTGTVLTFTDVTARRDAEAAAETARAEAEAVRAELARQNDRLREQAVALAEGELRLRSILDNSAAVIFAKDRRGGFLMVNRDYARRLGKPESELLGLTSRDVYPPAVAERLMAHDEQVWATGTCHTFEERVTIAGKDVYVVSTRFPLTNAAGQMVAVCGISTDITARKAAEADAEAARAELARQNEQLRAQAVALAEGELQLRSILDNAGTLIAARDREGRFVMANRAYATRLGTTPERMVGRSLGDYYDPSHIAGVMEHDERVWRTGRAETFEEAVTVRGTEMVAVTARFPLTDAAGRMRAVAAIATDITPQKVAEAQAVHARAVAEAASAAKSEFLANMSHEIRTPLNGVIGMAELLLGTPLTAEQARFATVLRTSADALLGVINQVMDFSKIEAGKLELEQTPFDLGEIVGDVVQMMAHRAAAKGLALTADLAADVPRAIAGDPVRLRQILVNLVNNAVKFTDHGHVAVRVRTAAADVTAAVAAADVACGVALRFEVADTGPGIPADRLDRLFKSFSQVDASTTRRHGGTGLGLAISARLAALMGGRTGVDSTVGAGSTFWFTATVQPAARQCVDLPEPAARTPGDPADLAGLRVLVAEDNEVNQEVVTHLLTRMGCVPTVVGDGRAAVDAVAADPAAFDLVLMDCQMPVLDGFAAATEIRRLEAMAPGRSLPILALTASAVVGDRDRCLAAGMDGYVTKPIQPAELRDALLTLSRPRRAAA